MSDRIRLRDIRVETYVDVEVDWRSLLDDVDIDDIKDYLSDTGELLAPAGITDTLNDPITRLEVITWLRANGYTVEPVDSGK